VHVAESQTQLFPNDAQFSTPSRHTDRLPSKDRPNVVISAQKNFESYWPGPLLGSKWKFNFAVAPDLSRTPPAVPGVDHLAPIVLLLTARKPITGCLDALGHRRGRRFDPDSVH
jgi:hypothetical protein